MKTFPVISRHAIERYRQRVEPASQRIIVERLARIIETATVRARPRHWMRVAATAPGTRYLYSAEFADVCLVVADGVVVTVHSREACRVWMGQAPDVAKRDAARRPSPYRRDHGRFYPEAA